MPFYSKPQDLKEISTQSKQTQNKQLTAVIKTAEWGEDLCVWANALDSSFFQNMSQKVSQTQENEADSIDSNRSNKNGSF